MLKVLDISGYDEIAIIGNRTGNLQVVFKIFSGETDGFINTACILSRIVPSVITSRVINTNRNFSCSTVDEEPQRP